MRILHVDPDDVDNPMSGGGPIRTLEVYRRLSRRHEITVLTPTFPGSTPELIRDGVRYVRLGRRIGNHGSSHHFTFMAALPRAIRNAEFDLLVEDLMPPTSVTFNPLFARGPILASVQWFFARILARKYHLPFHWFESLGLRLYSDFLVQTADMEALIRRKRPSARITLIPPGTDQALFDLNPRYDGQQILYLGRVDLEQKGLDLLLAAWSLIPAEERSTLLIAGHGFQDELVRQRIRTLGLDETVRLLGRVAPGERAALFGACRFVVVPSREETFGMVIAEACAAGKPVVVFDRPPMNEVASRVGCVLIPPFDVNLLSEAIRRLMKESPAVLKARGGECRSWARQFSWDSVALAQEACYEATVETWNEENAGRRRSGNDS